MPAILARPMAVSFGVAPTSVFAAVSAALLFYAALAPAVGKMIDRNGGRPVLAASSLMLACGLGVLGLAPVFTVLCFGWAIIGVGMAFGLYEAAFATLAGLYGSEARGTITGITLMAGFASTVGWPVSAALLEVVGWRGACLVWAGVNLVVALPLYLVLVPSAPAVKRPDAPAPPAVPARRAMILLAVAFAAVAAVTSAMATHLPGLLQRAGVSVAASVAAAALVGPAQVGARIAEFALLRRLHPLVSARIAASLHPAGAVLLLVLGGPAAAPFALLHGAGNGMLTIARGTVPLALFGSAAYGLRTGMLVAPARLLQAAAPVGFAWALQEWGAGALWLTAALSLVSLAALLALRSR